MKISKIHIYFYSWSYDGNWIVSVNHHYIRGKKIFHARLINTIDLDETQILIGHDSAVMIAVIHNIDIIHLYNILEIFFSKVYRRTRHLVYGTCYC